MTASLPDRLYTHVDRLAGLIGPRHLGRPESIRATLKLIESEFAALGDHVAHETYPLDDTSATNLVIERAGETRPEQIVLLGAHYDTVPETPGADDNASAVAVLIEVARLLQPVAHRRTIRFVAFACEEPPHFYTQTMGSEVHARGCRRRGEQIVGMLCLEMVGYFCDRPRSQRRPPGIPRLLSWFFPTRGDFVAAVGNLRSWRLCWTFRRGFRRAARFPLFSIVLPEAVHEIRLSDNGSFWDYGYPALMLPTRASCEIRTTTCRPTHRTPSTTNPWRASPAAWPADSRRSPAPCGSSTRGRVPSRGNVGARHRCRSTPMRRGVRPAT